VLNEAYAHGGRPRVSAGGVDSSLCERPTASSEDTGERQDVASLENQAVKRKVHSLIDKGYSRTNLALAWEKVKQNHGRAGIDAVTITEFEANEEFHLERLHRERREGTYQPQPVKRVEIAKADGGVRKLGIPTVRVNYTLIQRAFGLR